MSVLIADDDVAVRRTILLMLQHAGLEVDATSGGNECIRRFMTGSYDLVISDLDMPDLNGVEVARRLRYFNPQIELYAFSGSSGTMLMDEAKTIFNRVFRKPLEITSLVAEASAYCSSLATATH